MATPNQFPQALNTETVRDYILSKGGRVYNTDLVKYFKPLLIHPNNKDLAREEFKRIINSIAVVLRDERDEKYLILKRQSSLDNSALESNFTYSPSLSSLNSANSLSTSVDSLSSFQSGAKQPPPYRSPPPVFGSRMSNPNLSNTIVTSSSDSSVDFRDCTPPPVPPRRKSSDKMKLANKENESDSNSQRSSIASTPSEAENKTIDAEQKISVKERTQRFNRLASVEGPSPSPPKTQQSISAAGSSQRKRFEKGAFSDRDEEDCVSVTSFDPRSREWLVRSAQGNYQALAKMCAENSKLARTKDPATGYTALHWGAKHGNMDIVKLVAGSCKLDANVRSNGGYTPLHIAAQFNRDEVFELLTKVYGADPNLRDWSGRKPNQYRNMTNQNSSLNANSIRKTKLQKKNSEKDNSFLRIGSLNVRVKRTTEAVSNFLGVSQSNLDKAHKTWGSADSIQDCKRMPPPKLGPPKKRKQKHPKETSSARGSLVITHSKTDEKSDSDSDTAFGFDSNWKQYGV